MDVLQITTPYNNVTILSFTENEIHAEDDLVLKLMEPWAYTLAAIVLMLIGIFGFTLNISVIIIMCKDRQLWTPMNVILFNLVCSDFSVSVLGNPFAFTAALSHKWIFGHKLCIAYGFFMALLGITSITTLTVLSYERFCLVKFPFSTRQLNNRGAMISIGIIWIYSLLVTTPPLFGWGAYVNEAANISCSVNWESKTSNTTSYIVFLFVFGLLVPVLIILHSYINIIVTMRTTSTRLHKTNKAENRVTWMVLIMIIAFMVAWTPYSLFALIEQFGNPEIITPAMAVLPSLFAKSSICYNPVIYVGMNTQYRQALKRIRGKESTVIDTIVNILSRTSERTSDNGITIDKRKKILDNINELLRQPDIINDPEQHHEEKPVCDNDNECNEEMPQIELSVRPNKKTVKIILNTASSNSC